MEHPRPVVPVGEHPLVRPAIAHDVTQAERLELRQGRPLEGGDVGLSDVGLGIEHIVVGRCDVHVATDDRRLPAVGNHLPQRSQPGELVLVVLRVRHPPVRYVHRDHPDPATRSRDRARLWTPEARRAGESHHNIIQTHTRKDGDSIPRGLAVNCDGIPAVAELVAEQVEERIVCELGLLQTDHVRPPLIQPRQQPRHALLDRVDVPGRDSHRLHGTGTADGGRSPNQRPLQRIARKHRTAALVRAHFLPGRPSRRRPARRAGGPTPIDDPAAGPGSLAPIWSSPRMYQGGATPAAMKWWGWGEENVSFSHEGKPELAPFIERVLGLDVRRPGTSAIAFEDLEIPAATLPAGLRADLETAVGAEHVSTDDRDRVVHGRGKSLTDLIRQRRGDLGRLPDVVVRPAAEDEVAAVVRAALEEDAVVIPFGGGSSISGSLEAESGETRPVISIDMSRLNRVLSVDATSQLARVQAGVFGPDLERQLGAQGWTCGHFPDSFAHSTLGGWIATRSSGMQSDRYGDIAEITRGLRVVTPSGVLAVRPVPSTSTGPSVREMVLGSEGRLGVITEATIHVRR